MTLAPTTWFGIAALAGALAGFAIRHASEPDAGAAAPLRSLRCPDAVEQESPPDGDRHRTASLPRETPSTAADAASDEQDAMATLERLSITGARQPWTRRQLGDPLWGPQVVADAAHTWQELLDIPLEVDCDEYPCLLMVDRRLAEGPVPSDFDLRDAMEETGQWPAGTPCGITYVDIAVYGVAACHEAPADVQTRFFWRAQEAAADRGDAIAMERSEQAHERLDALAR